MMKIGVHSAKRRVLSAECRVQSAESAESAESQREREREGKREKYFFW